MADIKTPRRSLFGATAAVLLLAQRPPAEASPAAGGDTELLQLCTEFHGIHAELLQLDDSAPDDVCDPLTARWWAVLRQAVAIPATTPAGIRAKAALFPPAMLNTIGEPPYNEVGHQLAHALVEDILRSAGA